jgi:hypothetical protein
MRCFTDFDYARPGRYSRHVAHDPDVSYSMLESSQRALLRVSRLRVIEAWFVAVVCLVEVALLYGIWFDIALACAFTTAIAFGADAMARWSGARVLGDDPSQSAPPIVKRAIAEAAYPLGIPAKSIYPRRYSGRHNMRGAFAAAALHTERGDVLFLGDEFLERANDAAQVHGHEGTRRFAYDEIRAVLGHEIAHLLPGTGVSSRVLSIPYRFSLSFPGVLFWTAAIFNNDRHAAAAWLVVIALRFVARKVGPQGEFVRMAAAVVPLVITVLDHGSFGLFFLQLVWPHIRPIPAMAIQRRIEHACDQVAIGSGADPSSLARFLQRFESEHRRYARQSTWAALHASHPPLHKRIVTLDTQSSGRNRSSRRSGYATSHLLE